MSLCVSARLLDPQFQGQMKESSTRARPSSWCPQRARPLRDLAEQPRRAPAAAIAELSIARRWARQKSAQKVEKKKTSGVAVLPGKLSDCESEDIADNELFLVEGDSAGGSGQDGRESRDPGILPLRGKVQNAWEIDPTALRQRRSTTSRWPRRRARTPDAPDAVLRAALRQGRHHVRRRRRRRHIQTLLLTLFFRHSQAHRGAATC